MSLVLKTTVDTEPAKQMLARLAAELTPEKADKAVEKAAFKVQRMVIIDTIEAILNYAKKPRWNLAKPENKWMVEKIAASHWIVVNRDKVMRFLEFGTKAHGPNRGRQLYTLDTKRASGPESAGSFRLKFSFARPPLLYIPLARRAAGGYRRGFKWGIDFIMAKWVKGIRPYGIVETARRKAADILKEEFVAFARRAVQIAQRK